jgi:2,4-dienoyl-CoA reductase-like NADH-dependent reductase (Old Yellow Enzyme family)
MEENMAAPGHLPGEEICQLYNTWAKGGTGLFITGNVMVDHRAMTGPGGIALELDTPLEPFKKWVAAATQYDAKMWMQINHPGRQVYAAMGGKVLSPSDIALNMGKHSHLFGKPTAITEAEINEVIERFVTTATRAAEAGFHGVQIHAAHGYLISQFLSPLTNQRQDKWGGSLENRARLLFEIVTAVKNALPAGVALAVKLNSADFQRGGFDANDALEIVKQLEGLKIDLVELSGGSYESPAMQGGTADGRTLAREAYFLEFAKEIAEQTSLPIMTTGGITRLPIAQKVIDEGVEIVGIGRALAFNPELPKLWQTSPDTRVTIPEIKWKDKTIASVAMMAITKRQLHRMGKGKPPKLNASPLFSLIADHMRSQKLTKIYRKAYQKS